ncbi:MAG: ABC transporter ATP-binding protein [Pirellulales bacterium]
MNETVIRAEKIGKRYRVGRQRAGGLLTEMLSDAVRFRGRRTRVEKESDDDHFWALSDVSFEVKQGEIVGIIGRNGAGKSTLLKVLSRITSPTKGRFAYRGRIASLLEVGTGFHPELSGRENIYLNGGLLGMKHAEITRKFDEIVAFAEVERFIDTPVKHYSSGMYVRLAFAVAAHLEPENLIIDEVLAVGDAAFQKKCLGKMDDVAKHGRTVLFVSHSMPMIQRLCTRAIVLENGRVVVDGTTSEAVKKYMSTGEECPSVRNWKSRDIAPGNEFAALKSVRILDEFDHSSSVIAINRSCAIEIEYWKSDASKNVYAAFTIRNEDDVVLFGSADFHYRESPGSGFEPGVVRARCQIPAHMLAEGKFSVTAAVVGYNPDITHGEERDAVQFQVVDQTDGTGVRGSYSGGNWPGVVRPWLSWRIDRPLDRDVT